MEIIIIGWLVLCSLMAVAAGCFGRSALAYFLGSLFFSPILAGICLLIAGNKDRRVVVVEDN